MEIVIYMEDDDICTNICSAKIMDTKDINWDVRWVNHGLENIST